MPSFRMGTTQGPFLLKLVYILSVVSEDKNAKSKFQKTDRHQVIPKPHPDF
jgi:hypothetical protein